MGTVKTTEFQSRMYRDKDLRKTENYRYKPILILGAGAIGAAVIVQVVSQGYGNLWINDFDRLEISNLSRSSFLYHAKEDIGKLKAEAAAQRAQENMIDGGRAIGLHMDAMDMGAAFLSNFIIVICCLDSIAARIHVSNECRKAGVPLIETGTNGLNAHAQFLDGKGACYSCFASDTDEFAHHSCAVHFREAVEQGQIPATPVASTISAALAANLMASHFCDICDVGNKKLLYDGRNFGLLRVKLRPTDGCPGCENTVPDNLIRLDATTDITLAEFLSIVEKENGSVAAVYAARDFITKGECPVCGKWYEIIQPKHKVYQRERKCPACAANGIAQWTVPTPAAEIVSAFSVESDEQIHRTSLFDLGFPRGAFIVVRFEDNTWRTYGFYGDLKLVEATGHKYGLLPNLTAGGESYETAI